jgi:hypothetical protein
MYVLIYIKFHLSSVLYVRFKFFLQKFTFYHWINDVLFGFGCSCCLICNITFIHCLLTNLLYPECIDLTVCVNVPLEMFVLCFHWWWVRSLRAPLKRRKKKRKKPGSYFMRTRMRSEFDVNLTSHPPFAAIIRKGVEQRATAANCSLRICDVKICFAFALL